VGNVYLVAALAVSQATYGAGFAAYSARDSVASAAPSPKSGRTIDLRERPQGGAGTRLSAGFLTDIDQNAEVRGSKWYGSPSVAGISQKMRRDAHARKSADYVVHPLAGAKWRFRPASSDALDREVADFATHAFFERLPWSQIVRRVATGYMFDGFAIEEVTDGTAPVSASRFPHHPRTAAAVVPTGFHQRPAWSVYRWHQNKTNPAQIESIQQYIQGSDGEKAGFPTVSADRLWRLTWDQDGADFDGLAPMRSAYGPWKIKQLLLTLLVMGHERFALGVPVMTLSEDPADEDVDAAEQVLAELRAHQKAYVILPNGYDLDLKTATFGTDVLTAIEAQNKDMAINVGAGHMMLGLGGKNAGSYALASTQQGQLHLEVDAHGRFIATCLTLGMDGWSPAERIVRANYGPDVAVPHAEAMNLPTRDWESVAKTYGTLVSQRAIRRDGRTEDQIRESVGLPPFDPESAIEDAPPPVMAEADPGGKGAPLDSDQGSGEPPEGDSDETGAAASKTPDATTPKEQQTIFGYHLQLGVAKINEARKNLNLPPVDYGDQTAPEFLASLQQSEPAETPAPDPESTDEEVPA